MFLLHCPRCRGETLHTDDTDETMCRCCGWHGRPPHGSTVRDPQAVRQFVAKDLRPVADLMLTFGIGQTIIAALYFYMFFGCGGIGVGADDPWRLVMLVAIGVVLFTGGVLIFAGAHAVYRGRWRMIAVVGAIFALTSPLLIGLPVGVWALRRLNRPEVRAAFKASAPSAS